MVDGWVAMTVFREFEGGYLGLPDLSVRVPFQPGDVIFCSSALLEHYVTRFKGQRYSVVFITKETVLPPEGFAAFIKKQQEAQENAEATTGGKVPAPKKEGANARKRRARKLRERRKSGNGGDNEPREDGENSTMSGM